MKEEFTNSLVEFVSRCNEIDKRNEIEILRDKILHYFQDLKTADFRPPVYISDFVYMFSAPTDDVIAAFDAIEDSGRRVVFEEHFVYIAGKEVMMTTVDVKEAA